MLRLLARLFRSVPIGVCGTVVDRCLAPTRGLALAALLILAGGAMASSSPSIGLALDALVQRENEAGRFDGVVLVGQGDTVLFQRAIGWADRAKNTPHRVDEPWRWASVSKQVTALITMRLVERGRLSLDDRLDALPPAFKAARAADISVRDLLRHTSGLPNPNDTPATDAQPDAMPGFYTRSFNDDHGPVDAALGYCAGRPLAAPGERFLYNNCDTLVLQAVLERRTGKPYARLMADEVARPLGVTQMAFAGASAPAAVAREGMAVGTPVGLPVGRMADGTAEPAFNLASYGAGGAIVGTPEAMWRFDRALMNGELLGAAATRTMWEGDPKLGYVALGAWSFPARLVGCSQPLTLVERRGEIGGVQVRNLLVPDRQAALIVFSNNGRTEFGEIWQGRGLAFERASAAFCAVPPRP